MKKCLSVFLSLLMVMGTVSAVIGGTSVLSFADGETSGTCGVNLTWSFDESTGTLTISGEGEMEDYNYSLTPWYSYSYENSIKKVVFDGEITSIGDYAFRFCTGLTSITIPDSVTSIGNHAFESCTGLTSITIPASVASIGDSAFWYCFGLTDITIPDGVTSIGNGAFSDCTGLTSITIPDSVTSIGINPLQSCSGLESISVDENNPVYHSIDNCLIETGSNTLIAGCENSIIPNDGSITSIGDYAFRFCTGLTSITIPDSVTSIGDDAFAYCTGLTSIIIPDSITSIGMSAFSYCAGLESISVDENNTVYHSAGNCIIETESKKLIAGCKNSIIPDDGSVTIINKYAFAGCTGLTSVTIPDSVTSIGRSAFLNCTGLTSVTIPDSVTSIGESAFTGCTGLTSVTIPDSVTSIGNYAFESCTGLTSITIPDSVTSIGYGTFLECTGLTSITIPDSVTSIGDGAFSACTALTNITIPENVTSIGRGVFTGCTGLESISVDENNPVYHSAGNCLIETESKTLIAGFKKSIIPDDGSVTNIGIDAFFLCEELAIITIPGSVTNIGDGAFEDCNALEYISIADSVTSIGNFAFAHCTDLTDVYYTGSEEQWNNITIGNNNEPLLNAAIHYNSTGPEEKEIVELTQSVADPVTGKEIPDAIKISTYSDCEFGLSVSPLYGNEKDSIKLPGRIMFDCMDIALTRDGVPVQPDEPVDIYFSKDYLGTDINDIYIVHYKRDNSREAFHNKAKNDDYLITSGTGKYANYWKITVTSLSPFGIYCLPTLNVKSSATVDYKANVTVTATAENVPKGYVLAIYEGSALKAKGNAESVSYKAGTMTAGRTFTVKVVDSNGNALKDLEENEITSNCEVKVNGGFFAKLIAFFKGLFGALPNVEIKP